MKDMLADDQGEEDVQQPDPDLNFCLGLRQAPASQETNSCWVTIFTVDTMKSFRKALSVHFRDNASSIYSRSPDTAKDAKPTTTTAVTPPLQTSFPEINSLDHQIAMAGGSTMVVETTRPRLKVSKKSPKITPRALKKQWLQQRSQQERENEFYSGCFRNFHRLVATVMDSTQDLALQYHFNPGTSPAGDPRLIRTIVLLKTALDKLRAKEAQAEAEWKRQCGVSFPRLRTPPPDGFKVKGLPLSGQLS
jgi:hypothetical protein